MKKKLFSLMAVCLLVVVGATSLVACGPKLTDWEYIEDKGSFIVGWTAYTPMANADQKVLIEGTAGFDIDLATAVGEIIGVKAEFRHIEWDVKEIDLEMNNIDVIWNGMTISEELKKNINVSKPYLKNTQVVVVRAENADWTVEDFDGKGIAVEKGSAGDAAAEIKFPESVISGRGAQIDVFPAVLGRTVAAGVVDALLAVRILAEDAYVGKLVISENFSFPEEEFGIGFRKGDDIFMEKVWAAIEELKADGTLLEIATKYDIQDLLLV